MTNFQALEEKESPKWGTSSWSLPVARSVSCLMALVMLFPSPVPSILCGLPQSLDLGKQDTFTDLDQMGTTSLLSCLKYRIAFKFPQEQVDGSQLQKAQAISVLHEMLQQIFNLFHAERSSAAWDTTLLDNLRTGLHPQLKDLDTCLVQVMGEQDSAQGRVGPTLAVKSYFQGIHLFLKEKTDSDCAWEIVQLEIRSYFLFINKLIGKLRE
ncbi:interferon omega-1 [Camelus dromedarius]